MRRSAFSVPVNIVEGYARTSKKEALHFYNIAQASLVELEYEIGFAHDLGYLSKEDNEALLKQCRTVGRLLRRFIQSKQ